MPILLNKIKNLRSVKNGGHGLGKLGRIVGTRKLIIGKLPSLVPYIEQKGKIIILRIMHTSMKWPES